AANVVYAFCLNVPEIALPLVLVTGLHASPAWSAAIFVANTVLVVTLQVPVTVVLSRFSRRTVLAVAGGGAGASGLGWLAARGGGGGRGGVGGLCDRGDHLCRQRDRAGGRGRAGAGAGAGAGALPALDRLRAGGVAGGDHRAGRARRGRPVGEPRRGDGAG